MRDLCIPLPGISEVKKADIIVLIDNKKTEYHYRIESFPWAEVENTKNKKEINKEKTPERLRKLKLFLMEYDRDWELIQIFDPAEGSKFIQVLYRKRTRLHNLV
jgi:hypothetical protein